tara:strand:+ start:377 stop:586 length:210 start_codon:yes stop_codon:yes gene_type:complete
MKIDPDKLPEGQFLEYQLPTRWSYKKKVEAVTADLCFTLTTLEPQNLAPVDDWEFQVEGDMTTIFVKIQ